MSRAKVTLPKITETDVVRSVKEYLEIRGFRMYRRNVGGAYRLRLGVDRFVRFAEKGAADLTGREIGSGRTVEVEVKKPGAKTDPQREREQRAWLDLAKQDGCIAFQAASVEEADERLAEYGFPKRLLF